jgi:uncharacterized membrane protein
MTRWKLPQRVGWATTPSTADGEMRRLRAPLPTPSDFASGMLPTERVGKGGRKIVPTMQCLGRFCQPYETALAATILALTTAAATAAFAQAPGPPTDAEILALMKTHCVACHAAEPTHEAFAKAPAGILLETIPQIAANAPRIMTQVVVNRAMPLGNQTGMTDEERDRIAAWIERRRPQ